MSCVLVVDDSASAREFVQMILSEAGFRVITAPDGRRAIQVLLKRTIHLIITDIYMPEEDGIVVIRNARTICPQTPILAVSGVRGVMDMLQVARYLGASATLQKPFSRTDLLEAVDLALGAIVLQGNERATVSLQRLAEECSRETGTLPAVSNRGFLDPIASGTTAGGELA